MVSVFSKAEHAAIEAAIAEAEQLTGADIVLAVTRASDAYSSFVLLYGLALGSLIAMGIWLDGAITGFPWLLTLQLAVVALFSILPFLRLPCLWLVPRHIRRHRAARRAFEEYLIVSRHSVAATPMILFYISQAERYAHIIPSRSVRVRIRDAQWQEVIAAFTASVKRDGLQKACGQTIAQIAALLAVHFPATGDAHAQRAHVIDGRD